MSLDIQFEPLEQWPKGHAPTEYHERSRFRASYSDTLDLLERELRAIGAESVVIQADLEPKDIRLDGLLRAHARPNGPGIVLSFEVDGTAFMYPCDTFRHWQDNLRAIALTLQKLRAVDRYGVSKHGEQYTGWRAIPENTDERVSPSDAATILLRTAGGYPVDEVTVEQVVTDPEFRRRVARKALAQAHPDRAGGTVPHFQRVQRAREALDGALR